MTFDVEICDGPVGQERRAMVWMGWMAPTVAMEKMEQTHCELYPETAGPNCANGGTRLDVGTDEDNSDCLRSRKLNKLSTSVMEDS